MTDCGDATDGNTDLVVRIRVVTRAARDECGDERDGRLVVRTTAPPVDDKANGAVRRILAAHYRVPARAVEIVAGRRARDKTVRIRR